MRIEHIGSPVTHRGDRPLEAEGRDRPGRRCRWNRQARLISRLLHFVQQRDLVSGSGERGHQRTEVRSCPAESTVAPVHDGDAHGDRRIDQILVVTMTRLSLNKRPRSRPPLRACHVTDVHLGTAPRSVYATRGGSKPDS